MRKYTLTFFCLLAVLVLLALFSLPDKNLHLVFCDVGQGDAILATYGAKQILVDGGPDNKVISCLGKHMPFWDRKIEVVIVTHPQEDHYGGLVDVVRRYNVGFFLRPEVEGTSAGWQTLISELASKKIDAQFAKTGDKIRISNLHFDILHPTVASGQISFSDLNEYSVVGNLTFGEFDALLTGDIIPPASDLVAENVTGAEVLKVPHHGSKNGLTEKLLQAANPKLSVISVGKNNRYGHPHEEVMKLLGSLGARVMRTDLEGEVEVVSDGHRWWVVK